MPSLDGARLDPAGTLADPLLGDQRKQAMALVVVVNATTLFVPRDPQLHGVLETDLTR